MSRELPQTPGEKLHPLSPLFVFLAAIWSLIPALLPIIIAGRISRDDSWQAIATIVAAVAVSAYAVFYTRTFRFWLQADEMIVTEGFFDRSLRHIPFARISNIAFKQNLLHRLFNVVELNLESGAGIKPEAKLTVLTMARAQQLQTTLRTYRNNPAREVTLGNSTDPMPADLSSADHDREQIAHQVPAMDLLRLGLISNKGMLVIGGAWVFASQSNLFPKHFFKSIGQWFKAHVGLDHSLWFWLALAISFWLVFMLTVRIASIAFAFLQFHDFRLFRNGATWRVEHGLLTRSGGSTETNKFVALCVRDGWLYRWFKRQTLQAIVPGAIAMGQESKAGGMTRLSPVAEPPVVSTLASQALAFSVSSLQWHPLHHNAWRRTVKWPIFGWTLAFGFVAFKLQSFAALLVLLVVIGWAVWEARKNCAASGYALTEDLLAIKTGWFSQSTLYIPRRSIESVQVRESGFDRSAQMAHLNVDLAAGSATDVPRAIIKYLPVAIAWQLFGILRKAAPVNPGASTQIFHSENLGCES
jgi:putative membrane protein